MKKGYIKPASMIIAVNDTEYLLIGGSGDYTDSEYSLVREFYKEIELPRWKPKYNERYYSVNWLGRVMSDKWYGTCDDELSYQFGNIFKTHKEAELVRDKIKKLLNQ